MSHCLLGTAAMGFFPRVYRVGRSAKPPLSDRIRARADPSAGKRFTARLSNNNSSFPIFNLIIIISTWSISIFHLIRLISFASLTLTETLSQMYTDWLHLISFLVCVCRTVDDDDDAFRLDPRLVPLSFSTTSSSRCFGAWLLLLHLEKMIPETDDDDRRRRLV